MLLETVTPLSTNPFRVFFNTWPTYSARLRGTCPSVVTWWSPNISFYGTIYKKHTRNGFEGITVSTTESVYALLGKEQERGNWVAFETKAQLPFLGEIQRLCTLLSYNKLSTATV